MAFEIVEATSKLLRGWVGLLVETWRQSQNITREEREKQKTELLETLEELGEAAINTRAFLANVELRGHAFFEGDPNGFPAQARQQLARQWLQVSNKLARIDGNHHPAIENNIRELGERCFQKAQYWANPVGWTGSKAEIRLDELVDEVRAAIFDLRQRQDS
jgi:hypothetical protein